VLSSAVRIAIAARLSNEAMSSSQLPVLLWCSPAPLPACAAAGDQSDSMLHDYSLFSTHTIFQIQDPNCSFKIRLSDNAIVACDNKWSCKAQLQPDLQCCNRNLCSPLLSQPPVVICSVSGSSSLLIQPSGHTQVMLLRILNIYDTKSQLELEPAELFGASPKKKGLGTAGTHHVQMYLSRQCVNEV
jgi:hypothetical protein